MAIEQESFSQVEHSSTADPLAFFWQLSDAPISALPVGDLTFYIAKGEYESTIGTYRSVGLYIFQGLVSINDRWTNEWQAAFIIDDGGMQSSTYRAASALGRACDVPDAISLNMSPNERARLKRGRALALASFVQLRLSQPA